MLSFIVPAHNEEHELPLTLQKIHEAARADGRSYEVIVVDDSSTDATSAIARQHGARVVSVGCRQIAAVRNAGARIARGEVLFFVDADTQIARGHISGGIEALASGSSGGSARLKLDAQVPVWARVFLAVFSALYFGSNLGVGAFIFTRRETFRAAGGFDEQYFAGEELYLTQALKKHGPFKILSEPIVTSARKVRMHSAAGFFRQWLFILFGGRRSLQKRERLGMWYDGKRERKPA